MAYQTSDHINGYSGSYHRRQASSSSDDIDQEYRYDEIEDHPASSSYEDSTPRSSSHQYYDTESVTDSVASSYAPSTAYSMKSVSTIATTAPSRAGPNRPTWLEQFGNGPQGSSHNQGGDLWCEFCVVADCGATFHLNEENAWITHHLTHLNHTLPSTLVCWFCDDYPFSVDERAPPADRQRNFVDRMRHIHGHIQEDESLTMDSMRPDFYMADHMFHNRLIDEDMYIAYKNYTELPRAYQIPGTYQNQRPLGPPTPPQQNDNWAYRSPDELANEERQRRRAQRSRR